MYLYVHIYLFFHHRCDSFVNQIRKNEELIEMDTDTDTFNTDTVDKLPYIE